jgi:hypothetical protein
MSKDTLYREVLEKIFLPLAPSKEAAHEQTMNMLRIFTGDTSPLTYQNTKAHEMRRFHSVFFPGIGAPIESTDIVEPLFIEERRPFRGDIMIHQQDDDEDFWRLAVFPGKDREEVQRLVDDYRKKGIERRTKITDIIRNEYLYRVKSREYFKENVRSTCQDFIQTNGRQFKLNFQMGYITSRWSDRDEKYNYKIYFPTSNVTSVYFNDGSVPKPKLIKNMKDVENIIENINDNEIIDKFDRPDSQVSIIGVYGAIITMSICEGMIGSEKVEIPSFLAHRQKCIIWPSGENNMCFWQCLAISEKMEKNSGKPNYRRIERRVDELLEEFNIDKNNYRGATNEQIAEVERRMNIGIDIFSVSPDEEDKHMKELKLTIRRISPNKTNGARQIKLGEYEDHFYVIKKLDGAGGLLHKYICECGQSFTSLTNMYHHVRICSSEVKEVFSKWSSVYKPRENDLLKLLKKYKIDDLDHYFPYEITFDFEALIQTIQEKKGNTEYSQNQRPISVSVYSNVPDFQTSKCFIVDIEEYLKNPSDETKKLIKDMIDYMEQISEKSYELLRIKYERIINIIEGNNEKISQEEEDKKIDEEEKTQRYIEKKTNEKEMKILKKLKQIPVVGFNSGKYDLNLIKEWIIEELLKRTSELAATKKGKSYMSLSTEKLNFLDECFYLSAGTNLDGFIRAYQCSSNKAVFPYDWFDNINKLLSKVFPPYEAFYSNLKGKNITKEEYEASHMYWNEKNFQTFKEYLEYYNNQDVIPFLEAIEKQKEFYKCFNLDMFRDGISLPGLAEKIMYIISFEEFEESLKNRETPLESENTHYPNKSDILRKIQGYDRQDHLKHRECSISNTECLEILKEHHMRCHYCHKGLISKTWTLDRKDCSIGHQKNNCIACCLHCNKERSDKDYEEFYYQKRLKEYKKKKPLIQTIDDPEIFHKLKKNVVGGPSIIGHRYHKAGETYIQKSYFDGEKWNLGELGQKVKKIIGYDANALYLWCLGNSMPCGKLKLEKYDEKISKESIIEKIQSGEIFGFLECDIEIPKEKYNEFREMCPIFKNVVVPIEKEVIGETMYNLKKEEEGKEEGKDKKLICSMFGKEILIYTPLLKWYMFHGLIITKVYSFIHARPNKPFIKFMDAVAQARRNGDSGGSEIIAEMMKLIGNSSFGRSGMNKNKQNRIIYCLGDKKALKYTQKRLYRDGVPIGENTYEITMGKRTIRQNMPIQVASAVYQLAKLRMLEFFYDCIKKYVRDDCYQFCEMDTDSLYLAIAGETIEDIIKPEMREEYEKDKENWFGRTDTREHKNFDKRTPGLFKVEVSGVEFVGLSSKMYYVETDKQYREKAQADYVFIQKKKFDRNIDKNSPEVLKQGVKKFSAKGIGRNNVLSLEFYKRALFEDKVFEVENKGLRYIDGQMKKYEQKKRGLNYFYIKRRVDENRVNCHPLMI